MRRRARCLGYRAVQVLDLVQTTIAEEGQPPSYSEICDELGFADRADVCKVVERLEQRGLLRREGTGRVRRIRLSA